MNKIQKKSKEKKYISTSILPTHCTLVDEVLAIGPQARAPVDNGSQEGDSAWVA